LSEIYEKGIKSANEERRKPLKLDSTLQTKIYFSLHEKIIPH
jgi:hypothetical protein